MSTVVEPEELSVENTTFPLTLTVKSAMVQNSNVNAFLRDYLFSLFVKIYGIRKPSAIPTPSPAMRSAVVLTFGGGAGGGETTKVGVVATVSEVVGLTVGTVGDVGETVGE